MLLAEALATLKEAGLNEPVSDFLWVCLLVYSPKENGYEYSLWAQAFLL